MESGAKKLLKASLGDDDLQYMKVESECVVATNETILTIVFNADGFGGRTGIYSKDFDKIDVESDYIFPNWIEAFPKGEALETLFIKDVIDLVCFLGSKFRGYPINLLKDLPNMTDMNVLLYEKSVMIYYPDLEMITIIRTTDLKESLGIGSAFKEHKAIVTDIELRQRKKFEDEDHQLELFEGHKLGVIETERMAKKYNIPKKDE